MYVFLLFFVFVVLLNAGIVCGRESRWTMSFWLPSILGLCGLTIWYLFFVDSHNSSAPGPDGVINFFRNIPLFLIRVVLVVSVFVYSFFYPKGRGLDTTNIYLAAKVWIIVVPLVLGFAWYSQGVVIKLKLVNRSGEVRSEGHMVVYRYQPRHSFCPFGRCGQSEYRTTTNESGEASIYLVKFEYFSAHIKNRDGYVSIKDAGDGNVLVQTESPWEIKPQRGQVSKDQKDGSSLHIPYDNRVSLMLTVPLTKKELLKVECKTGTIDSCIKYAEMSEKDGYILDAIITQKHLCEKGRIESCLKAGDLILETNDTRRAKKAKVWFGSLCDKKMAVGCYRLGKLELDLPEKQRLYLISCEYGWADGCYELAHTASFYHKREELMGKACGMGSAKACGEIAEQEMRSGNIAEAKRLHQFACDKEDTASCFALARLEEAQGNHISAAKYLKLLCDRNYVVGCVLLQEINGKQQPPTH